MPYNIWEDLNRDENGTFVDPVYEEDDDSDSIGQREVVEEDNAAVVAPGLRPAIAYLDPAHPVRFYNYFPY